MWGLGGRGLGRCQGLAADSNHFPAIQILMIIFSNIFFLHVFIYADLNDFPAIQILIYSNISDFFMFPKYVYKGQNMFSYF